MLKQLTDNLSPKKPDHANEADNEESVVGRVQTLQRTLKTHEDEQQEKTATLNKSVITNKWLRAKDVAVTQVHNVEHEHELQQRDDMLRKAHEEHAAEVAILRKEMLGHGHTVAESREEIARHKQSVRQLESRCDQLKKELGEAKKSASDDRFSNDKRIQQLDNQLAQVQVQLSAVVKKERHAQLYSQKLQHDALVTDTVLSEQLAPDVLRPIRQEVLRRMESNYNNATNHFIDSEGQDISCKKAPSAQFDKVHKMYNDVLEQKAAVVDQSRKLEMQLSVKGHELSQAGMREASLAKQLKQAEYQIEMMEPLSAGNAELKDELARTQHRAEAALNSERDEVKIKIMELEGALLRVKDESKSKYEHAVNETRIKEMKIAALQSELEVLHKASNQAQDTPFSKAIKNVITKQREDKNESVSKILKMHNARTPNSPERSDDTSVEQMYRDLLHENNTFKLQAAKLQTELDILKSYFPTYSAKAMRGE